MKKIIHTISVFFLLIIFAISFSGTAFAQEGLFDTLEDIKKEVEKPQSRTERGEDGIEETVVEVKLVDFSGKPWGNLPEYLQEALSGFTDLDGLQEAVNNFLASEQSATIKDFFEANAITIEEIIGEGGPMTTIGDRQLNDNEIALIAGEMQFRGEGQINSAIRSVAKVLRNLLGAFAALWIVISGIQMVLASGDESKISEQKKSITYAIVGLVAILLLERMVDIIYGMPGTERGLAAGGREFSQEILGIVSFMKAIIGGIAMLMIVISGIKIIGAQGEEDKITSQHKAIMWIVVGVVVILVNQIIVENIFISPSEAQIVRSLDPSIPIEEQVVIEQSNINAIIGLFGKITQFVLGFVGLAALATLIYGAGTLILNLGEEKEVEDAKKIIKNALIGIVIILSAFAIVSTVII